MTQWELIQHLRARLNDDWMETWEKVREHRRESLERVQEAVVELFAEQGMSNARFRLELDYIVRAIEERGP